MNTAAEHYKKLERMYLSAPINHEHYPGIHISVTHEKAEIAVQVEEKFFHAAGAIHGSVYFKLLDDAAFFAVNSIVRDAFVYTVSFHIQLLRPVSSGTIKAVGEVKFKSKELFIADATLWDEKGRVVGRGSGNFMKSKMELNEKLGYQ
ncbi:PaaI family thioesterase [Flavobacterium sp. CYK-4]|uniref:PaaI family thioesterase n=1 Tax=Flavobacterium lotistagni TaxID=2709660 RepID=UPI00140E4363|nr:PaaI family thioesterase [Flavobacterium lotistagni]NHM05638.1 PaaI family thioesterase [Flavobacterium lotistagni]